MSVRTLKRSLVAAAGAAAMVFGFASSASAVTIGFDLDGAGGAFVKLATTKFSLLATQDYKVDIDLGNGVGLSALQLSSGDTFSETLRLNLQTSLNASSAVNGSFFAPSANTYSYIDVLLTGVIQNCNAACANVTSLTPDFNGVQFDIAFTGGGATWYYDANANHSLDAFGVPTPNPDADTAIATLSVLSGGGDNFIFANGTATSDVGVTLKFNTPVIPTNTFFGCSVPLTNNVALCNNELSDEIALNLVLALADASVNVSNAEGSPPADPNHVLVTIGDNGTTLQVAILVLPEPTTLLLFGTGLLGLGIINRRKRKTA